MEDEQRGLQRPGHSSNDDRNTGRCKTTVKCPEQIRHVNCNPLAQIIEELFSWVLYLIYYVTSYLSPYTTLTTKTNDTIAYGKINTDSVPESTLEFSFKNGASMWLSEQLEIRVRIG